MGLKKCKLAKDEWYCYTHQCGTSDAEQCGRPECPHCDVDGIKGKRQWRSWG